MREFILVEDALTKELMIIRKSMICTVESTRKNGAEVRKITYIDDRLEEFVTNSLEDIMNDLENKGR